MKNLPVILLIVLAVAGGIYLLSQAGGSSGLSEGQQMSFVFHLVWLVVIGTSILMTFRKRWVEAVKYAAIWMLLLLAGVVIYTLRYDFERMGTQVLAAIVPGMAVSGSGGETTINRNSNGQYETRVRVNGRNVRMLVDTGASLVSLSYRDAQKAGLDPGSLAFDETIYTANGRSKAAYITIQTLELGSIKTENIDALVLQPDATSISLLGMSFLSQMATVSFEDERLLIVP